MTFVDEVTEQLCAELRTALRPFATLAGFQAMVEWEDALLSRVPALAGRLCQDDSEHLAYETCVDVMGALWPRLLPDAAGRPQWWQTPLGRVCARALENDDTDMVSRSTAAAMLGVTHGTIQQLVHRGSLERHPEGGLTRASVLARLVRLNERQRHEQRAEKV